MELPEEIRGEIEQNPDKELIFEVVERLQRDGVTITRDVVAAIVATMESTNAVLE